MRKIIFTMITSLFIMAGTNLEMTKQKVFDELYLIMTKQERQELKKIGTINQLKAFVFRFWKVRDPEPETPDNKVRDTYYARLRFAAKNFKEPDKKGWLTDRGRIFVLLGPPTSRYFRYLNEERKLGYNTDIEDSVTLAIQSDHSFRPNAFQHEEEAKGLNQEKWIYQNVQLELYFVDKIGNHRYLLYRPPARLLTYIEEGKKYFMPRNTIILFKKEIEINADVDTASQKLYIHVPLQSLVFYKKDNKYIARIELQFYYERPSSKIPQHFFKQMEMEVSEKDILDPQKRITIPLNISKLKGTYVISIIIRDMISDRAAKKVYRLKI